MDEGENPDGRETPEPLPPLPLQPYHIPKLRYFLADFPCLRLLIKALVFKTWIPVADYGTVENNKI